MELSCRPELNHPWGARFIRSRDSARPDLPNGPDLGSCWDFHRQRHPVRAWPPGSAPGQVGRGLGWPGRWMGLVGTKPSRSLSGQPSKHRPVAAAAFAARALTKGDPVGPTYNHFSVWNSRVGGPILVAISWPDLGGNCGMSCRERLWFFCQAKNWFCPAGDCPAPGRPADFSRYLHRWIYSATPSRRLPNQPPPALTD